MTRALLLLALVGCATAEPATRTPAQVRDSLVYERAMTESLRVQSTARIRRLDSIYARIDRRRVVKVRDIDSLLARLP